MIAFWKAPALLAAAFSLVSASEPPTFMFVHYPLVHRVDCLQGRGTAFRVGQNHWLSVAHVTSLAVCEIDGQPIHVTNQDGAHDFAELDTLFGPPNGMKLDCNGFTPGRWYYAIGYPGGGDIQAAIAIYATYVKAPNGFRVLIGPNTVIPGMSGGPVIDAETGKVVGTTNAYIPGAGISLSRELKDTRVCTSQS